MEFGSEIGRGGFGIVYEDKNDLSRCIKVSNKKQVHCRQWSNEHKKLLDIQSKISDYLPRFKMVRLLSSLEFNETSSMCHMILPRIFRPNRDEGYTIQSQIGCDSCNVIHKGRGEFIGLKEILNYISYEDLELACYELGKMVSLIHFIGKNDCYDMEVFLGKEHNSRKIRFYIADFDLSEQINEYDHETVRRMAWSLDAVPYFPNKEQKVLFERFKKGYEKYSTSSKIVEQIFESYG